MLEDRQSLNHINSTSAGDLVWTVSPILASGDSKKIMAILVIGRLLPKDLLTDMAEITTGFENYQQMKMLKKPVKMSNLITLSVITSYSIHYTKLYDTTFAV